MTDDRKKMKTVDKRGIEAGVGSVKCMACGEIAEIKMKTFLVNKNWVVHLPLKIP